MVVQLYQLYLYLHITEDWSKVKKQQWEPLLSPDACKLLYAELSDAECYIWTDWSQECYKRCRSMSEIHPKSDLLTPTLQRKITK